MTLYSTLYSAVRKPLESQYLEIFDNWIFLISPELLSFHCSNVIRVKYCKYVAYVGYIQQKPMLSKQTSHLADFLQIHSYSAINKKALHFGQNICCLQDKNN